MNTDAVKRFFELQYSGRYDEAFSTHANPEFSWAVGMGNNPELTGQLFGEYEPLEFDARRYHDTGEVVFAEGYFRFRHRRTGKIAEAEFAMRFDMRDGRISGG